jgi:two-component system, response regulator
MALADEAQTILIVEDSEDDFEATMRAFKRTNLKNPIRRAASGMEALSILREGEGGRPGLVLLDLNMPGLDGRRILAIIKSDPVLRKIPVVVLTTSSDERDIEECYVLGANTYIQKPVDLDGLFAAIQRLKEYWFEIALLPRED